MAADAGAWPSDAHLTKVLLLNSCTQAAMMPAIDAATARVLDRLGVQALIEPTSGCCGAIRYHLNDHDGGLDDARRTIDAWWPYLDAGVEAIVMNASGCGVMVKEYGHLLRNDPVYAERAARVSSATVDLIEWLPQLPDTLRQPFDQVDRGRRNPGGTLRIDGIIAQQMPVFLDHHAAAGGVHHDRLDPDRRLAPAFSGMRRAPPNRCTT